ncbi:hypothetical protein, partial [Klebsiella pneumoniae]|uniref:hypothetical protein n=1 Tax=Klebsiella pneumoniae TaxID=573 RepID=UPI001D0EA570
MTSSPSWLAKRRNRQAKVNRPVTFVHKKSPNGVFGLFLWTKVTWRLTFAWRFFRFSIQLGEEGLAFVQIVGRDFPKLVHHLQLLYGL